MSCFWTEKRRKLQQNDAKKDEEKGAVGSVDGKGKTVSSSGLVFVRCE